MEAVNYGWPFLGESTGDKNLVAYGNGDQDFKG